MRVIINDEEKLCTSNDVLYFDKANKKLILTPDGGDKVSNVQSSNSIFRCLEENAQDDDEIRFLFYIGGEDFVEYTIGDINVICCKYGIEIGLLCDVTKVELS